MHQAAETNMTPFDQRPATCRCEWGIVGYDNLAPADVTIVVDVLSFSTCVDVAAGRGVAILPYVGRDAVGEVFASDNGAELAGPRGVARYSLSPASFLDAPRGIRCVLPSPNGAALTIHAAGRTAVVLAGCLRNAAALAYRASQLGSTFPVCPAGERWPDGSLRPAIEDLLGAGAILRHLPGQKSPEALVAIAAFDGAAPRLADVLAQSSSGRELIERGFVNDVEMAAAVDVSQHVPRYDGLAFVDDRLLAIPAGQETPAVVVTAYRPDPPKWDETWQRRRP